MTHDAHDEYEQPRRGFIVKIEEPHHTISYSLFQLSKF
jgi:hypothetical protein